jgi:hypothetical protein
VCASVKFTGILNETFFNTERRMAKSLTMLNVVKDGRHTMKLHGLGVIVCTRSEFLAMHL